MPDDDLVVADEDFLDEKPQDALAFQYVEGPRRRPQSCKERGQRFSEAQVGCAVDGLVDDRLQLAAKAPPPSRLSLGA